MPPDAKIPVLVSEIRFFSTIFSNEDLKLSDDKSYLMSIKSNIKYPIIDGIPILIETESF